MSINISAPLITQFVPDYVQFPDHIENIGHLTTRRVAGGTEQSSRHAEPGSMLAVVDQVPDHMHTPEVILASFRKSILESLSHDDNPITIVTALLSQSHATTVAAQYARILLEKFGSIGGLLRKSADDIARACPLHNDAIFLLKTVHRSIAAALREPVENRPIIATTSALEAYLKFTMASDQIETVRTLFLNSKNVLIKDEVHSTGTIDGVNVSTRELVRRTLELGATALIIVHNHPSGDPQPSQQDIAFTGLLKLFFENINVVLHDHVIVGRHRSYSFKAAELL